METDTLLLKLRPSYRDLFERNKDKMDRIEELYSTLTFSKFHKDNPSVFLLHLATVGITIPLFSFFIWYDKRNFGRQLEIWKKLHPRLN